MDSAACHAILRREGSAFAALLTADAFTVPVAGCPGWTVADLARHLGGIHRWARHAILTGPSEESPGPEDLSILSAWYRQGLAELLETLENHDEDHRCWTFAEPPTVRFWSRRQAHETTLHRWDVESSLGLPATIAEPVAVDGIDEVVHMFRPRQLRLGRLAPRPEAVVLACTAGDTFTVGPPADGRSPSPDATVSGPAEALLLLLWGRIPLTDERLEVSGSAAVARDVLSGPLTP